MSYTKTTWSDGDIITANKMNNIETGVESLNTDVGQLQTDLDSLTETVTDLPSGGDYQELVDDVSDIKADITNLKTRLDEITPLDVTLKISGKAADAKKVGDGLAENKSKIAEVQNEIIRTAGTVEEMECGLTEEVKTALLACFEQVAWIGADGQTYYDALETALNKTRTISSINAVFAQGSAVVYDTDELYSLKQYLTVTATYNDTTTKEVSNYTLEGTLTAGTNTITVAYGKKTTTFNVTVTHQQKTLESITATFSSSASITTDNVLDDLRPYLAVRATYSDGSTQTVSNYTLSGSLNVGTNTITVTYGGKTTTFTVNVIEAEVVLQSITATFTQGSAVIYTDSSLNDLKPYLTVTANYSDSTTQTVTGYTLSGTLTAGTSTITASYSGKTATFNVNVTERVTLQSITATFNQGSAVIYTYNALNDLRQYLTATANYSDGTTRNVTTLVDLKGTLTTGTSTITAEWGGKSTTFTVEVTEAEISSVTATFNQGSAVIREGDLLSSLKPYLTVTVEYGDGTTQNITDYKLSGSLLEGTSTITATYGTKSATFTVNVSESLGEVIKHYELSGSGIVVVTGGSRTHPDYNLAINDANTGRTVIGVNTGVQCYRKYSNGSNLAIFPIPIPTEARYAKLTVKSSLTGLIQLGMQARTYDENTKYSLPVNENTGWVDSINGTAILNLTNGGQYLVAGSKYSVNGEERAFSPSTITELTLDFVK